MAGIDGIQNKIDPGKPLDEDIYELSPKKMKELGIATVPGSLGEALDALEKDHEFLLKDGVFTKDVISTWAELRQKDIDAIRLRPHPYEFKLYFGS